MGESRGLKYEEVSSFQYSVNTCPITKLGFLEEAQLSGALPATSSLLIVIVSEPLRGVGNLSGLTANFRLRGGSFLD